MSSPFPQLRTKGDKDACSQHVKRAMLELFKTQDLQERMGVPVFKRTVPVNDYTEIEVQVVHGQKFIEIRCFPPSKGLESVGRKDEDFDTSACPAAFVVRKLDTSAKQGTTIPAEDKEQGYIIAYNHARKKWEIATYQDTTGSENTFASCANIGWWHARGDGDGYTGCDVVTWYGSSFFDFTAPFFPTTYVDDDEDGIANYTIPAVSGLQKVVMFKGRRFLAPNYVLGACIISDAGIDYMYVHTCNQVENPDSTYRNFYCTVESSSRCKLSTLFASDWDNVPWELVGSIFVGNEITFAEGGFNGANLRWNTVQGPAYVDKNGYSYVLWCAVLDMWTSPTNEFLSSYHVPVWMKYNLRDMGWEMIWDPTEPANRPTLSGHWSQENGTKFGGHYPIGVSGSGYLNAAFTVGFQPMPVYQWPGTKDHYVLWADRKFSANHNYTQVKESLGGDWQGDHVGDVEQVTTLFLTKNGREIERFDVQSSVSGGACTNWVVDFDAGTDWSEAYGTSHDMMIVQWHPDIPGSFVACKREFSNVGGHLELSLIKGNPDSSGQVFHTDDRPAEDYSNSGNFWGYLNVGAADLELCSYTIPGSATDGPIGPSYLNYIQLWGVEYYGGAVDRHSRRTALFGSLVGIGALCSGFGSAPPGGVIVRDSHLGGDQLSGTIDGKLYLTSRTLGSSTGFWVPQKNDDWGPGSESYRTVALEGYAVHHRIEIDGGPVAPYIYLERPLSTTMYADPITAWYVPHAEVEHSLEDYQWRDSLSLQNPFGFLHTERLGYWRSSDPAIEGHKLNVSNWKVKSNVLSEAQIKKLTNETDNMLLEIGVL